MYASYQMNLSGFDSDPVRQAGRSIPHRRVLFILDPFLGHVTVNLRGLIFKDLFARNGWTVDFVSRRPEGDPHSASAIRQAENRIVELSADFDVVYLLKVPSLYLVKELKKRSAAKVVFDLTDALWKPYHRRSGWHDLERILVRMDAVFSENEYICAYGRRFNNVVLSIPACTRVERFDEMRANVLPKRDDKVVIGWAGSSGTVSALAAVQEPLETLFGRHANLELRIVGCGAALLPPFEKVRFTVLPNYNEDDMIREVLGMDIGIFPPPFDLEDYEVRGALKAMIYMTAGIPAVCQNAGDCARIIQDGVNGMLASTNEEWTEKLDLLIRSPSLRREMGQRALESIRAEHSLSHVFQKLEEALLTVINSPGTARRPLADLQTIRWWASDTCQSGWDRIKAVIRSMTR